MADLYGVAIGGGLSGNVDANARKVPATATWLYNRNYMFIGITGDSSASWGNSTQATYEASNSDLHKLIRTVQKHVKVIMSLVPHLDGTDAKVILAVDNNDWNSTISTRITDDLDAVFTGSTHSITENMYPTDINTDWSN